MKAFVYYGGKKIEFEVPSSWNILFSGEIELAKPCLDVVAELKRALDQPIGSPPLEELASRAQNAVVIFDDITRPTPTHIAIPEILNRLNRGGISDAKITAICATGTHQPPDQSGLKQKLGAEAYQRLYPRVICHDAKSRENVLVGRTSRGTPVEINPFVANADVSVGIGACFPHGWAGFGGGSKIIMPGVCGIQSIAAHHFTWFRNPHSHTGCIEGNLFYEECNEIAQLVGFKFKIDFLLNFRGEVIKVFCGDVVEEHSRAIEECARIATVEVPRKADITISAAYPLERGNQSTKSLASAAAVTKSGGQIIWVAPQPDRDQLIPFVNEVSSNKSTNEYHRQLIEGKYPDALKPIGLSFMCTVVDVKNLLDRFSIIHVTDGLDRAHVESMKMGYAPTVIEAIEMARSNTPSGDVVVFGYGGVVLPKVTSS